MIKRVICTGLLGLGLGCSSVIMAEQQDLDLDLASFEFNDVTLNEFDEFSVPVVLTATRIQQHQSDVPASVTILDADLIKRIGAKNLPDILRYVPGMMIGPDRNNNADSVHYHGGPAALPKNLQVLVNGRSMYRAGLAAVSWYEMPVAIEDIRRIEVVRGPNSASYGANAYQAVINILTKHPSDTYGSSVVVEAGDNGDHYRYAKHGGHIAGMDYRLSMVYKATDHYQDFTDAECDTPCRDDKSSQFINLETHKVLESSAELETSFVLQDSEKYIANPNDFQANDNVLSEQRIEIGARYTKDLSPKHQIKVSAYLTQFNQRQSVDVENVANIFLDDDLRDLYALNQTAVDGDSQIVQTVEIDSQQVSLTRGDQLELMATQALQAQDVNVLNGYLASLSSEDIQQLGLLKTAEVDIAIAAAVAEAQGLGSNALDGFAGASTSAVLIGELETDEQALASQFLQTYTLDLTPGDTVTGTVNAHLDEYRFDIEVQDTYIYSPNLTLVSGVSLRKDMVRSDHYFDGDLTNTTSRIFGSATWKAMPDLNLHLGLMGEKETDLDLVFAPRAAANYKLTPTQSMRLVYSESVRSPDFFEQSACWNFEVENAQPANVLNGTTYYQVAQSDKELSHQKIASRELGYYGRFNFLNAELDVKYFIEEQTDVIYQSIRLEGFESSDDNSIEFEGIEFQGSVRPWKGGMLRMAGAHIEAEIDTPTSDVEATTLLRIHAKDQVALSWFQDWHPKLSSSLNYIHYSKFGQLGDPSSRDRFERIEAQVFSNMTVGGFDVELALRGQQDIASDSLIETENQYEDETRVQLAARVSF